MHHPHDEVAMTDSSHYSPPKKFATRYPTPPSMNYLAKAPNGVAGRKRSRADIGEDFEDSPGGPVPAPPKPKAEPIFGPGMTLIYPEEPRLNISPESQTGTWAEERADTNVKVEAMQRPRVTARKSQRLSRNDVNATTTSPSPLEIDPIVLRLGIGWKRIPDAHAPAVAGQQNFIKKQFSFNNPQILLQHEGLGIFIVRTKPSSAEGYWDQWWLFTNDLKSCRFLCHDENDLFRRLSNKRQDDRGNWQPDILVEGPVVRAKDVADSAEAVASAVPRPVAVEDVEMQG
jgi:hypothetical protein